MDSFDQIQLGDEVTLIANKTGDGTLIPDTKRKDHSMYSERFTTIVVGKRKNTIMILIPSEIKHYSSIKSYEYLYKGTDCYLARDKIPADHFVYEIYEPGNVVSWVPAKSKCDGMPCKECGNFYPMAEPNFGDVMVCWSCRNSTYLWKYKFENGKVMLK